MRYLIMVAAIVVAFFLGLIFGDSSGAVKLGAFLSAVFNDSKTAVAVASAIFALLSLLIQFWVGSRQAEIGAHQADASRISADAAMLPAKNAGNRAIASLRISWIETLRKILSEYHSILLSADDPISDADQRRVSDLGTQLDLMLNVNEENQKKLWEIADKIFRLEKLADRRGIADESSPQDAYGGPGRHELGWIL
jgi:hypothetical protein